MPIHHMETASVRGTGQALGQYADALHQMTSALRQSSSHLSSSWSGPSSEEFANTIGPELLALAKLAEAGMVLQSRLIREVEEWERVDSHFGTGIGAGGPGIAGPGVITPEVGEGQVPAGPVPPVADQLPYDLGQLIDYRPDYPEGLGDTMADMHEHFVRCVRGDCPDTDLYRQMAEMTGLTEAQVMDQYARAVEAARAAGQGSNPAFDGLSLLHRNHWGSRRQLMFGKVVGDHLGIHPVFAALLNPSGGIIGPSDEAITIALEQDLGGMFNENAWEYHGAAHDAYGYLYNHHETGPGYQYVDSRFNDFDPGGTGSPLSGQISGYIYWARQMGMSEVAIDLAVRRLLRPGLF